MTHRTGRSGAQGYGLYDPTEPGAPSAVHPALARSGAHFVRGRRPVPTAATGVPLPSRHILQGSYPPREDTLTTRGLVHGTGTTQRKPRNVGRMPEDSPYSSI